MDFFLIALIVLCALAIFDLMVGVSNDAVNFLNSAVGSQVATLRTILIIASLGVFVGATFSSGLMEVARKGIFNPTLFTFADVMAIFLAVMLTDVILLDLFNTFGLPTSTTVSIVFELLGAAFAVALVRILQSGAELAMLGAYMNTDTALTIIAGILLSVVIAFSVGTVVQFLSRILFSFDYKRRLPYVGALWAGLATTALVYFLLIKGVKGASFVTDGFLAWVEANTWLLLGGSFVVCTGVMQALLWRGVNILKPIVLLGTFSLAMAFAGNDLVNFIGVPIAGLESFLAWRGTGTAADAFTMEALAEPVRTSTWLLLLAGGIMVITLWLSKKARTVTETEVNLGRQDEGLERFTPGPVSRGLVRGTLAAAQATRRLLPDAVVTSVATNYDRTLEPLLGSPDRPAFDLVRASVNLSVASMLISLATSYGLPLSTTYVSFMVAMGASLADQAWGRESAVYRVSGVLSVIGGWFVTALAALTIAGTFAFLLIQFGGWALTALVVLAVFSVSRTMIVHRRREAAKEKRLQADRRLASVDYDTALADLTKQGTETLETLADCYSALLGGLFDHDRRALREAAGRVRALQEAHEATRHTLHRIIRHADEEHAEVSRLYLTHYDLTHDLLGSLHAVGTACETHVLNVHEPLTAEQIDRLDGLRSEVAAYLHQVAERLQGRRFDDIDPALDLKARLLDTLDDLFARHARGVKANAYNRPNNSVVVRVLLDSKDLVAISARFLKVYHRRDTESRAPVAV